MQNCDGDMAQVWCSFWAVCQFRHIRGVSLYQPYQATHLFLPGHTTSLRRRKIFGSPIPSLWEIESRNPILSDRKSSLNRGEKWCSPTHSNMCYGMFPFPENGCVQIKLSGQQFLVEGGRSGEQGVAWVFGISELSTKPFLAKQAWRRRVLMNPNPFWARIAKGI